MKKFDNFKRALDNLEDIYKYEEPYDNVVLTGLTALFEICFEQSWKAMKEIMELEGVKSAATGSPKSIIKDAYQIQLIQDEKAWLDALASRNNVAHAYNEKVAYEIIHNTKSVYVDMFKKLRETMENR